MPELPDVTIYVEGLQQRIGGAHLERCRIASPFLLRSVEPKLEELEGARVTDVFRLGKRIVIQFENDLFAVLHLMIAGRLRWAKHGAKPPGRIGLAAFDFPHGSLLWTEASKKKRASLHLVAGRSGLGDHDRGGLEVLECDRSEFIARLKSENHTLKRSLTDPRLFSGIGNAYSDEILHAAGLSPVSLTANLPEEASARLYDATVETLHRWLEELRAIFAKRFPGPGDITAFREGFAVHGRYGKPCPVCGDPVQRIRYAENETNYCATCQTGGKLLADRSLSRLLKSDWPRSLDEMEELKARSTAASYAKKEG